MLGTIWYELTGASGAEPAGLVRGTVLGAVGMVGTLLSLLAARCSLLAFGVAARIGSTLATTCFAIVLVAFLVVALLGYRRFRRPSGGS